MSIIPSLKRALWRVARSGGAFELTRRSRWRRQRLLILCYHGISIDDEHEWNPTLYMQPEVLDRRLALLKREGYTILRLHEAVQALAEGVLPPGAVSLTFDDGAYDFYARAFPVLERHQATATVYQTTYYADFPGPVFSTFLSYLLWKGRSHGAIDLSYLLPEATRADLRAPAARTAIQRATLRRLDANGTTAAAKDALLHEVAAILDVDIAPLLRRRLLHLMNPAEIRELSARGIDFQLHTHRHRFPEDATLVRRELDDNRAWLARVTGRSPSHFCYPSGVYFPSMVPVLEGEGVRTATTCDPGIATRGHAPLLLPRYIDTQTQHELDFLSWVSGFAEFLPRRTRFAHGVRRDN